MVDPFMVSGSVTVCGYLVASTEATYQMACVTWNTLSRAAQTSLMKLT
jgi:hypothetical protein